jgi:hypothetical protein
MNLLQKPPISHNPHNNLDHKRVLVKQQYFGAEEFVEFPQMVLVQIYSLFRVNVLLTRIQVLNKKLRESVQTYLTDGYSCKAFHLFLPLASNIKIPNLTLDNLLAFHTSLA